MTIPPPEIINGLLKHGNPQSFAAFRHFIPVRNRIFTTELRFKPDFENGEGIGLTDRLN